METCRECRENGAADVPDMAEVLRTSGRMRAEALAMLEELRLLERWGRYGRPVVVGAVAYDLVYGPDLDMEIYCPDLRIEDGFRVLEECCATNPRVESALFQNHLAGGDNALYWQLRYRAGDGTLWKVDMWSAAEDYPLPRSEFLVEPMKRVLTEETRAAILGLKARRAVDSSLACLSIDLYRAVLRDGVRDEASFRGWLAAAETGTLSDWIPA
ncbi:hypothetical protein [Aminiphilus sp.]|jgi:hypothetical protein|uniref:hypothetical protein n=1 Tax=Aminiphilus sp. TaxID=1872488 RepID=UPI001BD0D655|nr:hypothetical protein [Aminiphilus sp.]